MVGLEDLIKKMRSGINSAEMNDAIHDMMNILARVYEKGFSDAIDAMEKTQSR